MNIQTLPSLPSIDAPALVVRCLQGDRTAFGEIVARHQSMICALAYNICGDLGRSEDLAQDTFVTAWRKLAELKEPANLKGWLCGIARNLAHNALRQQQRTPTAQAELISQDFGGASATPHEQAVTKEEAALLWRTLAGIPEAYREPMILFYRESQSTAVVAATLGLSEEAVRQRLSRGRAMLSERVAKTVEITLLRSGPTKAFTVAVLAALPAFVAPAKAAAAGAVVGKAGAVAKSVPWLGWLGTSLAASLGSVFFVWKAGIENTPSRREWRFKTCMIGLRCALWLSWMYLWHLLPAPEQRLVLAVAGLFTMDLLRVGASLRLRQIQIANGTWVQPDERLPEQPRVTLIDTFRHGSPRRVFAAWACMLAVVSWVPFAVLSVQRGQWLLPACVLLLATVFLFQGVGGWVRNQSFYNRLRPLAVAVGCDALICLAICNLPLLGLLKLDGPTLRVIMLNAGTALAYGALLTLLYWQFPAVHHRKSDAMM